MVNRIWVFIIIVSFGFIMIYGCAAPQQVATGLTAEQIQAQQDSIAKANEKELRKWRMFAYDKVKEKNWEKAREYFWKVVKLDVKHQYNDWSRIYQTYTEMSDVDSARIVLRLGLEHHPDDAFLNSTLGFYLKTLSEYDAALEHYRAALKTESENVDYLIKEGELLELLGRGEEAIEVYEIVLKITPDNQEIKDRYTSLLREYRDPDEYLASLEADVAANPQDENKQMELVFAYADQGYNENIIMHVDMLLTIHPGKIDAINQKALALENLNKLSEAISAHEAVLAVEPENFRAMLRIADNYRLLNKYSTARTWVIKARNAGDNPPEADFILAQVYESAGDACSQGRGLEFDDKLIFIIARELYGKATNGDDYNIKDRASSKYNNLKQYLPVYSDWFMNQTKKRPKNSCYGWVNSSWQEVKQIDNYLLKLSKSKS
ncbi:MAG: tetratricopeptide repeat protein [Candidatus Electryonea clarkiae]|nr:tetratricopeptide repeat protein [Candidatus Electryonea clarkiae]MDP8287242.1 tetratricopeptide repeat protein [Candidatus Electryonea clarkiae]